MLLYVYPLQRLHIGERYSHAFRHPRVFNIMQPQDTIRRSFVGTTDRSVVNGIKIPSLCCHCGQFETICLASTVSVQDKSDMIETWGRRQLEFDRVYNGVTKSIQHCRSDGFIQSEHEKMYFFI